MESPSNSRPRLALALAAATAVSASLAAQTTVVVPAANATVEGTSRISFPWGQGATDMRYQQTCVLGSSGLLKQIAHRRDNDTVVASSNYTAWSPALTLSVSTSPLAAAHMSPVFANNVGADVKQVFSGTLNWPAENKNSPGPTAFVYTIPFQSTFLYVSANGDINFDVQRLAAGANTNSLFFMDAAALPITSKPQSTSSLGAGCSTPPGNNIQLFYGNWIPGANYARLLLYNAAASSPAYWSVGIGQQTPPIDLTVIGAPGCNLYHTNNVLVPGSTSNSTSPYGGRWDQVFQIPNDPKLGGQTFYSQFVLLNDVGIGNAANLSVSDGQALTLGTWVPGEPAHSEAHQSGLAPTMAGLVQQGYGMITEFTF
ncbi:MAG: hypothetical protein H6836_04795 [Planctomycetes bacterium]|nr:hypothetical protein [Planctomycetota bacterium]